MRQYIEPLMGIALVLFICILAFISGWSSNYTTRVVHPVGNSTLYKVEVDNIFKPGDTIWYKSGNEQYRIVIVR